MNCLDRPPAPRPPGIDPDHDGQQSDRQVPIGVVVPRGPGRATGPTGSNSKRRPTPVGFHNSVMVFDLRRHSRRVGVMLPAGC
jgi:hypothetical protein